MDWLGHLGGVGQCNAIQCSFVGTPGWGGQPGLQELSLLPPVQINKIQINKGQIIQVFIDKCQLILDALRLHQQQYNRYIYW